MRRDQATEEEAGGGRPTKKVGWEPRPDSSMAGASLPCTAEGWVLQPESILARLFLSIQVLQQLMPCLRWDGHSVLFGCMGAFHSVKKRLSLCPPWGSLSTGQD